MKCNGKFKVIVPCLKGEGRVDVLLRSKMFWTSGGHSQKVGKWKCSQCNFASSYVRGKGLA